MDPKTRLTEALKLRDELSARHQRLLGRADEAEQAYAAVRQECVERGVDPDTIDESLEKLEGELERQLSAYEAELRTAQTELDSLSRKP